jgi:hypothetical protein
MSRQVAFLESVGSSGKADLAAGGNLDEAPFFGRYGKQVFLRGIASFTV